MTLQNLAKIGQLNPHKVTGEEVTRLLAAARRNLADAQVKSISNETRFDCGYKAVVQCALVAMMANGYRPSTSAPGVPTSDTSSPPSAPPRRQRNGRRVPQASNLGGAN